MLALEDIRILFLPITTHKTKEQFGGGGRVKTGYLPDLSGSTLLNSKSWEYLPTLGGVRRNFYTNNQSSRLTITPQN